MGRLVAQTAVLLPQPDAAAAQRGQQLRQRRRPGGGRGGAGALGQEAFDLRLDVGHDGDAPRAYRRIVPGLQAPAQDVEGPGQDEGLQKRLVGPGEGPDAAIAAQKRDLALLGPGTFPGRRQGSGDVEEAVAPAAVDEVDRSHLAAVENLIGDLEIAVDEAEDVAALPQRGERRPQQRRRRVEHVAIRVGDHGGIRVRGHRGSRGAEDPLQVIARPCEIRGDLEAASMAVQAGHELAAAQVDVRLRHLIEDAAGQPPHQHRVARRAAGGGDPAHPRAVAPGHRLRHQQVRVAAQGLEPHQLRADRGLPVGAGAVDPQHVSGAVARGRRSDAKGGVHPRRQGSDPGPLQAVGGERRGGGCA